MEPAGLAVGVLALAGLFNNAVDCFEYVQIGRGFGKNFQTSLLRLDVARLQLSRWGQSVGLEASIANLKSLEQTTLTPENTQQAEELLGQIVELFEDAEGISARYKQRARTNDQTLALYDATTDLDPIPASLHQKMRELSVRRQGHTGLRQKAKWALYGEKQFLRLIEDITALVQSLITVFPAQEVAQRSLCEVEISELSDKDSLPLLKEVAAGQDSFLNDAIIKAIGQSTSPSYTATFSGNNNSGFQIGQNTGTMSGFHWGKGS